jgi:hypothetical protein
LDRGHQVLRRLLGAVRADAPAATVPAQPRCPACHAPGQRLDGRAKPLHLTLGDVPRVRQCGDCPACPQTWAPLDRQVGVAQSGRSPRLVETIALLGTELPFAPAADRLAHVCGVRVGASQVQGVTEAVGRPRAAQQQAEAARVFAAGDRLPDLPPVERTAPWVVVALDGVLVPHRDGYQEVGTGAVAAVRPRELATAWPPVPWRYVVHPGAVATFGHRLWLEAHRPGAGQADRIIVLGDGAHGIWNLAQEHFPAAVQVVDLGHATEHLWAAGRALFGEGDERVAAWVEQTKRRLLGGAGQALVGEWATLAPKDAQALAEECTYFRNQAPRMAYHE